MEASSNEFASVSLGESSMRLDKYLQVTGLIKRRTLSNEACKLGLVCVNSVKAKPTKEIAVGDIIDIKLAKREMQIKVLQLISGNSLKKSVRDEYFTILVDKERKPADNEAFWEADKDE